MDPVASDFTAFIICFYFTIRLQGTLVLKLCLKCSPFQEMFLVQDCQYINNNISLFVIAVLCNTISLFEARIQLNKKLIKIVFKILLYTSKFN